MSSPDAPGTPKTEAAPAFERTLLYGEPDEPSPADTLKAPPPQMDEVAPASSLGTAMTVFADEAVTEALLATTGAERPTVLPRLLTEGEEPRLVISERQRFESLRLLGEGGAGEVFAAMDNDIDRPVAVKKMRAEVRSPEALARFVDEIRTIGHLEHPNIIPIHDVGVDEEGQYYFVMKYVDGETLEEIIDRLDKGDAEAHRRYPFEMRVQLFRGLLEAVAFAHSKGIVHRDIKPANVMVGHFGEVLLMDWGIARSIRDEAPGLDDALLQRSEPDDGQSSPVGRTQVGSIIGTPLYMSPEQARGEPVDERSDVYSLSVLGHELLSLHHYLEGRPNLAAVLEGVRSEPAKLASSTRHPHQPPVPMDLTWFLKKGLEKDRERRYQSADEMIARLDRRTEGDIPIQCHITLGKRVTNEWLRFVDHHPILVTVAGLALGGGGLALALWRLL